MSPARRWKRILAGLLVAVVVVMAAAVVLILVERPPAAFSPVHSTPFAPSAAVGSWRISPGGEVGYRLSAHLGPIPATLVGRTQAISGTLDVARSEGGLELTELSWRADLSHLHSGDPGADASVAQTLGLAAQPDATLSLVGPVRLPAAVGETVTVLVPVVTSLHLHSATTQLRLVLQTTGSGLAVTAATTLQFAAFAIEPPATAGISAGTSVELEFQLALAAG